MKVIDKILSISVNCGAWILAGTAIFITTDVLLRYIINWSIPAVYEITEELLMVIFIFLAMGSARHVSVDFMVLRLNPDPRRKVRFVSLTISFIFVVLLFIGAATKLYSSIQMGEGTECELGYPLWWARLFVMIGLGTLTLVQVMSFIKELSGNSS
jgi:TRAP-type C4-dicarboxylate transport system permease small subunit